MLNELSGRVTRVCVGAFAVVTAIASATVAAHAAVTISANPTKHMNCAVGVCTPDAAKANLNVTDLANMLASGDVKVVSDSAAMDIEFAAPLSWTSTSRLTLDSYHSIRFQQPISVTGTGALTITTNDGGSGGDLSFGKTGHVAFWDLTSDLTINRKTYILVSDIKQLSQAIAQQPSGHYALATDYNAAKDGVYLQSPIATTFTGKFEGLGNTIRGLEISITGSDMSVGLFAFVDSGGVLRDLNLMNATVKTSGVSFVGALAGRTSGSTIENVFADGSVDGGCCVAGEYGLLIGWSSDDAIMHASSSGSVSGSNGVGGLVGELWEGVLTRSHSSANVSSKFANVGGLVGQAGSQNLSGHIDDCFATGPVTVTDGPTAGGLVGSSNLPITNSFASGEVTTGDKSRAGGLAGDGGQVSNSYATGSATAGTDSYVGGLLGNGGDGARASYSTGAVSAGSGSAVGGLVGYDYTVGSTYKAAYWNLDTSGVSDPAEGAGNVPNAPGITGLTDSQLKSALPHKFNPKLWGRSPDINNGYPYLLANPPPK